MKFQCKIGWHEWATWDYWTTLSYFYNENSKHPKYRKQIYVKKCSACNKPKYKKYKV